MKGLLIKDTCVLIKKMKFFLILLLIFAVVPDGSFVGFAVMYSSMLPITAVAYDENSKWDELAAMMPYSAFELTFSKYLLGYAITLISAAVTFVIHGAAAAAAHAAWAAPAQAQEMTVYICVAFAIVALNLPFIFRFGTEKGRFAFIFITVAVVMLCAGNVDSLRTLFGSIDAGSMAFLPVFLGAAVLLNAVSVPLSVKFYKKRYR